MDWKIKSRSGVCQGTLRPFVEDEVFYTYLTETPEGMERTDLSEKAWNDRNQNIRPLCFWKSVFKPVLIAENNELQKEDAESELRRLLESDQSSDSKVCYLLALMLERKRILKVRERLSVSGNKTVIYEHTKTQETFVVQEPDLKLDEIDALKAELAIGTSRIFSKPDDRPVEEAVPDTAETRGDGSRNNELPVSIQ